MSVQGHIVICVGDARCFACTSIFIGCYSTRIRTSASLVRTGDSNRVDENLQVCAGSANHWFCLLSVHL